MFPQLSSTARAVTYYLLALGMCVLLSLVIANGSAAAVAVMVTPTVSVVVMQLVVTRDGWHRAGWSSLGFGRLRRLGRGVWAAAIVLPLAVLLVSESAVRLTGLTSWHLPSTSDGADLAISLLILPFFCVFEEIGWRGYLTPLLTRGDRRLPHLLTGLLHGIWHLPIVFLATGAYLTVGDRWVIVPVFLGVLTCSGPVYAWVRLASGSIYPAVVLHAAFNWGLGVIDVVVVTRHPAAVAALGREAGIATLVVLAAVAVWSSTWSLPAGPAARAAAAAEPERVLSLR